MKSILLSIATLLGLIFSSSSASAQTFIIYGQPALVRGDGTVNCADNDQVCVKGKFAVKARVAASASEQTSSTSLSASAPSVGQAEALDVVVFTANGPISFDAQPDYKVLVDKQGKKTYQFKRISPKRRVIYAE
ncbi:hypothetical protein KLP40_20695 [Hymenobacter sp. NST-14]|uniref:hypothetical protein n=1 Tax=Hymenobacter piscis TaxID=2839984 RepID=UPI001C01008C|nr:hypothetical protein [Hymenobacter piscis]MBT9395597.1 hypothetical protein [Hymenobacter piscis]